MDVYRIPPQYYFHVLNTNENTTVVIEGPNTFTRMSHQKVVFGPEPMVVVPPRCYVVIQDPVVRDAATKKPVLEDGSYKLRIGDSEIRFTQDPFPLYPGESLVGKVTPLTVVKADSALLLRALRDVQVDGKMRRAGDEWLFVGPQTYLPRVEVEVVDTVKVTVVKPNEALRLRAKRAHSSADGVARRAGEEWLVRTQGAYLPAVEQEIVATLKAQILTNKTALHLRAMTSFTDVYKQKRMAGEEWLVTLENAEAHIVDIFEELVGVRQVSVLSSRQFCMILNPVVNGKVQLGGRVLRQGPLSFFLHPYESLEGTIREVYVLEQDEALLLKAKDTFIDNLPDPKQPKKRAPGEQWLLLGPLEYFPPIQLEVVERRRTIPLDKNEGVYVRDIRTGVIRSVVGQSYMLKAHEVLWEKFLPPAVEAIIMGSAPSYTGQGDGPVSGAPPPPPQPSVSGVNSTIAMRAASSRMAKGTDAVTERDKTRVVTYRVPHNSAVQIYDYLAQAARVVFGPSLVMLQPQESFTLLSLSGGKPKQAHMIRTILLVLGPDFMSDQLTVETSDHARLQLQLSYNWRFELNREDPNDAGKLFSTPDFIGDACKSIASRVRAAVAGQTFQVFHTNSAEVIRSALSQRKPDIPAAGEAPAAPPQDSREVYFKFQTNNLVINSIDVQSVEPVDQRTRESLSKSVQLAIEITTKSQEAAASHEASKLAQAAKGELDRQKIQDDINAEDARRRLLEMQAETAAVESTGTSMAEARARAEAAEIEANASVQQAKLASEAARVEAETALRLKTASQQQEIANRKALDDLEVQKAIALAKIESEKTSRMVGALGRGTIKSMAMAGPEMQAKLLEGLGLKSVLMTDGNQPINLFNAADGLLGK